jgi:hypothetical protein
VFIFIKSKIGIITHAHFHRLEEKKCTEIKQKAQCPAKHLDSMLKATFHRLDFPASLPTIRTQASKKCMTTLSGHWVRTKKKTQDLNYHQQVQGSPHTPDNHQQANENPHSLEDHQRVKENPLNRLSTSQLLLENAHLGGTAYEQLERAEHTGPGPDTLARTFGILDLLRQNCAEHFFWSCEGEIEKLQIVIGG